MCFVVVAFALLAFVAPARASHWVVDQSGSGDFITIQAALDTVVHGDPPVAQRDSIVVMPGIYRETLNVSSWWSRWVIAVGGPGVTFLDGMDVPHEGAGPQVEGFTFTNPIALHHGYTAFVDCVFQAAFEWNTNSTWDPSLEACTFYGPASFIDIGGRSKLVDLRFVRAPVVVNGNATGPPTLQGCTFEGPVDTLLVIAGGSCDEDNVYLRGCRFSNAGYGVVYQTCGVCDRCVFADIQHDAIRTSDLWMYGWDGGGWAADLKVSNSRFERCGTAIRWLSKGHVSGVADTVLDCAGDGVVIESASAGQAGGGMLSWIVSGCGGTGILVPPLTRLDRWRYDVWGVIIRSALVTNCRGDGIHVSAPDTSWKQSDVWWTDNGSQLTDCRAERNGGEGFHLEGPNFRVSNCVALGNGSNGFDRVGYSKTVDGQPVASVDWLVSNTSVANSGDGFVVSGSPVAPWVVQQNLAALNLGAGVRAPAFAGSMAHNDAWNNYGPGIVPPPASADSNLAVDPRFCAVASGDLTLQADSPCGPGGVYGLVGALPVACPSNASVAPASARLAFTPYPNPARGSVEFLLPAFKGAGVLQVIDLQGRVRWHQGVAAGESRVRWSGDASDGPLSPGLYWARFAAPGMAQSRPLVWIR